MISRTQTFSITPEELAFEFCNLNYYGMAKFFIEVAQIKKKWDRPFCFQLQYVTDNDTLTYEARNIMQQIGEYSQKD